MSDRSEHFSDWEFLCQCPDKQCVGKKQIRASDKLIYYLEDWRTKVGDLLPKVRIRFWVASGVRCPAHNTAIGGAPNSYHLRGDAADVVVQVFDNSRWRTDTLFTVRALAVALEVCAEGGVGFDPVRLYTHVDVGPRRAWLYRS